jgi:hypothetical protein
MVALPFFYMKELCNASKVDGIMRMVGVAGPLLSDY